MIIPGVYAREIQCRVVSVSATAKSLNQENVNSEKKLENYRHQHVANIYIYIYIIG